MVRLFIGLTLPDHIKDQLVPMASGIPEARWIDQQNLHLTLRFIGEVNEDVVEDIHNALSKLKFQSFTLQLNGVDCFRSRNKVRSVWAGITPLASLKALRGRVESILVNTGLPPETRKFKPHVTLARLKHTKVTSVIPYLEANAGFQTRQFQVEQLVLFQSHLGHGGATYVALATYPERF